MTLPQARPRSAEEDAAGPAPDEAAVLRAIADRIPDPSLGLPDPVFHFALRLVPMVNVDLFVVDDRGRVLLAWREDEFAQGWHVPGGIVRGRESFATRIARTAAQELGAEVRAAESPAAILQLFGDRGHFISLVHRCALEGPPPGRVVGAGARPSPGDLGWFEALPDSVYPTHHAYRSIWDALRAEGVLAAPILQTLHLSERALGGRRG